MDDESSLYSIREEEIRMMNSLAARGQSLCIEGLPGVGKTALLKNFLKEHDKPGGKITSFYQDLKQSADDSSDDFLGQIRQKLGSNTGQLVYLFDHCETGRFFLDGQTTSGLKDLRVMAADKVSFFFTGSFLPGELYNFTGNLSLMIKPLDYRQFQTFLDNLLLKANFALTGFQNEEIYRLCGGHPKLVVTLLAVAQKQIAGLRWEEFKEKIGSHPDIKNVLLGLWENLGKSQQEALHQLIRRNLSTAPQKTVDLEELEKKGYLRKQNGQFQLFARLFESFLKRGDEAKPLKALLVEEKTGRVFRNGVELITRLTSSEYFLLANMQRQANKVISREKLLKDLACRKGAAEFSNEALDQLILRVRGKIELDRNNPRHLITLRGRGFQFIP